MKRPNETYREHARFARQLKRRAAEMISGRHDEANALYMEMAARHIAQLGRLLARLQGQLEAAETRAAA